MRFDLRMRRFTNRLSVDRAYTGLDGKLYEVFDPRWWQLWRWWGWLTSRRAKGWVTFECRMLDGYTHVRRVRAWEVQPRPRVRIEDQFRRPPIV